MIDIKLDSYDDLTDEVFEIINENSEGKLVINYNLEIFVSNDDLKSTSPLFGFKHKLVI